MTIPLNQSVQSNKYQNQAKISVSGGLEVKHYGFFLLCREDYACFCSLRGTRCVCVMLLWLNSTVWGI